MRCINNSNGEYIDFYGCNIFSSIKLLLAFIITEYVLLDTFNIPGVFKWLCHILRISTLSIILKI